MFGQQPYVYQQPIYNQPPMAPMPEPSVRTQYPAQGLPQIQNFGMICVPSRQAVDDFLVGPGQSVAFWNVNDPIIYVKKGKSAGGADTITYDLVERAENSAQQTVPLAVPTEEYVTRREFDELVAKLTAASVRPARKAKEAENDG